MAQDALKKDMTTVQAELSSMREEMKEILPEDVALVDRAFKQIDSLSRNDMDTAIRIPARRQPHRRREDPARETRGRL